MLIAILGGFAWKVLSRPREPYIDGKPLSVWLQDYNQSTWRSDPVKRYALRKIGTNAIPTLLRMLKARDSVLKIKFYQLLYRQTWFRLSPPTRASDENFKAEMVFNDFGDSLSNAVPDLIKIYRANISSESECCTASALGGMGPAARAAVPALLVGMQNTNTIIYDYTAIALEQIDPEAAAKAGVK